MISDAQLEDVKARFGMEKQANLMSIVPSVSGSVLGGYVGKKYLGPRFGDDLGGMFGAIGGGIGGRLLAEQAEQMQQPSMSFAPQHQSYSIPAGAPYAIDPAVNDIPPWALRGSQMLMKQSNHGGSVMDNVIGPDTFGAPYTAFQGIRRGDAPSLIAKNTLGQAAGTIGGGFAGHAIGGLLDKFVGHQMHIAGVPTSHFIAALGATLGAAHGPTLARSAFK